jgi:sugar phosphate isomerase/epimerase
MREIMYYTGFADEAGTDLDTQIRATKELGWTEIETRKLFDSNLAYITDAQFDEVCRKLDESGVSFNCFGSGVANWATDISESPEKSYEEMRQAVPRMQKLGIQMIRVMSFPVKDLENYESYADEAFKRMKTITEIAADGGITCVLENCSGWGSGSCEHAVRMLEAVDSPYFKAVFDTGNPVFDTDVRFGPPFNRKQDSWEYYQAVKDFIVYVHIKDGYMDGDKEVYTYPEEGKGNVRKIVEDLLKNGYDGGISIEPHLDVVFHDPSITADPDAQYNSYIEYGQRVMKMVDEVKSAL